MEQLIKGITDVATLCEQQNLIKTAENIDKIAQSLVNIKTAQYLGIQGYWIRNERCWSNCYRIKRANNPKMPAQEVWFACRDEYIKSINNDNSGWEKYAGEQEETLKKFASIVGMEKYAAKVIESEKNFFETKVAEKVKDGLPYEVAVYDTFDEAGYKYANEYLDESEKLLNISLQLKAAGKLELSNKVGQLALDIVKEAAGPYQPTAKGNWLGRAWNAISGAFYKGGQKRATEVLQQMSDSVAELQETLYSTKDQNAIRQTWIATKQALQQGSRELASIASKSNQKGTQKFVGDVQKVVFPLMNKPKWEIADVHNLSNNLTLILSQQRPDMSQTQTGQSNVPQASQGPQGSLPNTGGAAPAAAGSAPGAPGAVASQPSPMSLSQAVEMLYTAHEKGWLTNADKKDIIYLGEQLAKQSKGAAPAAAPAVTPQVKPVTERVAPDSSLPSSPGAPEPRNV
jgi:alkylhydroperoxidase/carboxymuconolactone decarboxylase family protein YurZ